MKTVIKIAAIAALGAASTGCASFEPVGGDGADDETTGAETTGGCESSEQGCGEHALRGEVIVFVNARLSDAEGGYASHLPLGAAGTYLGNALYAYDPSAQCEDGGTRCRITPLGNIVLDERLGEISVQDGSLKKFVTVELAHDEARGLWATTYDPLNDEWGVAKLDVEDWRRSDNGIGIDRFAFKPGPSESPDTDPCYWREAASGLGFVNGELYFGVRGIAGAGLSAEGLIYQVDLSVIESAGHCVHSGDVSQDPNYYACSNLCMPACTFGLELGVAGDIVAGPDGELLAWARPESDAQLELDRNGLYACEMGAGQELVDALERSVWLDEVVRGDEIDALARVEGQLYGVSVLGRVYAIDEETRAVDLIDDVSEHGDLFPDGKLGLKIRGATAVTIPD